ncbi:MAG: hypothetical protein KDC68_04485 [Gelidibacter sp.]|nr:hypothetical protein [Gelidibacter sp.]
MLDFSWLAAEAKTIYIIFGNLFYTIIGLLLIVGVLLEFFKFPVGGVPSFVPLVGRCFIAALMFISFPDFLNTVGDLVDVIAKDIGGLNEFKYVLAKMSDQLDKLTWSWTSVKQMTIVVISLLAFFILYISVYVSEAIYFYAWTLLYIFSPICFAMYVLPQTENIAIGVYRSIIKVASWKIIWSVLATLLWSAALTDLDKLGDSVNFLTIIIFNLMLAGSLLFTPLIASMLFSGNFASGAAKVGGFATGSMMAGAGKLMGTQAMQKIAKGTKGIPKQSVQATRNYISARADQKALANNPNLTKTPEKLPSHIKEMKAQNQELKKMDQDAIKHRPYLKHMPDRLPSSMERLKQSERKERLIQRKENLAKAQQKRRETQ